MKLDLATTASVAQFLYEICKDAISQISQRRKNAQNLSTHREISIILQDPTQNTLWNKFANDLQQYLASDFGLEALNSVGHNPRYRSLYADLFAAELFRSTDNLILKNAGAAIANTMGGSGSQSEKSAFGEEFAKCISAMFRAILEKVQQENPHAYTQIVDRWKTTELINSISRLPQRLEVFQDLAKIEKLDKDIDVWAKKYRQVAMQKHGLIQTPDFQNNRRVPFDELYVAPNFYAYSERTEHIQREFPASSLLEQISHTVILGDPGAGKSTFGHHLMNRRLKISGSKTPFFVVLREYAQAGVQSAPSILEFIEQTVKNRYQAPTPTGGLDLLFGEGRATVVFDGLDELIDVTDRVEVRERVEAFCEIYPYVDVLVTSRLVGYNAARLNETKFEAFVVSSFSVHDTQKYVRNWFTSQRHTIDQEPGIITADFMQQSDEVPDLRSNPLMLSLMCIIFRGENYIPRNRPAVLQKCADLLFEKWDGHRKINVPLTIDHIMDEALKFVAFWMYSQKGNDTEVNEDQLVSNLRYYLDDRKLLKPEMRLGAAQEFVEFCSGRAWVISEAGETDSGEKLFKFTHRTFLEFFTASHLCRSHETPAALSRFLLPKVAREEWDVVAQLAVQLKDKEITAAGEKILQAFLDDGRKRTFKNRENVLSFIGRCLKFVTLSNDFVFDYCQIVYGRTVSCFVPLNDNAAAAAKAIREIVGAGDLHVEELVENFGKIGNGYLASDSSVQQEGMLLLSLQMATVADYGRVSSLPYPGGKEAMVWTGQARELLRSHPKQVDSFLIAYPLYHYMAYAAKAISLQRFLSHLSKAENFVNFFKIEMFHGAYGIIGAGAGHWSALAAFASRAVSDNSTIASGSTSFKLVEKFRELVRQGGLRLKGKENLAEFSNANFAEFCLIDLLEMLTTTKDDWVNQSILELNLCIWMFNFELWEMNQSVDIAIRDHSSDSSIDRKEAADRLLLELRGGRVSTYWVSVLKRWQNKECAFISCS
ncbi:NACHT domain-containing protein [Kocuria marina]|uniref:NACHT domain-containing protein n=1 Tax=Kocuria marina TaxID=223184 RepID=UPI003F2324E8